MTYAFGVTPIVTNLQTHSVQLTKGKVAGKMKTVTLNYYPTSGKFTLTGPVCLRSEYHEFFHDMVNRGPIEPIQPQVTMNPDVEDQDTINEESAIEESATDDQDGHDNLKAVVRDKEPSKRRLLLDQ
jgi:hypothetical protein